MLQKLYLYLANNDIQKEGAIELGLGISKLFELQDLCLIIVDNNIQNKGAIELGLGISKIQKLSNLYFGYNDKNVQSFQFLDSFLKKLEIK